MVDGMAGLSAAFGWFVSLRSARPLGCTSTLDVSRRQLSAGLSVGRLGSWLTADQQVPGSIPGVP